jgi:hypothetical protein
MTLSSLVLAMGLQAVITAARIGSVTGEVEITRPGETATARNGDAVADGDRLRTARSGSLSLFTESGVTLQLKPDSRLEMKKVSGEPIAFLSEGGLSVTTPGKPVRIETRYGQIIAVEDSQEFEVRYRGDVVDVLLIRGSVTAQASEPSKILFKSAADLGMRVYEAGSITPATPRAPGETTVIVYPQIEQPVSRGTGANGQPRRAPGSPIVLPK